MLDYSVILRVLCRVAHIGIHITSCYDALKRKIVELSYVLYEHVFVLVEGVVEIFLYYPTRVFFFAFKTRCVQNNIHFCLVASLCRMDSEIERSEVIFSHITEFVDRALFCIPLEHEICEKTDIVQLVLCSVTCIEVEIGISNSACVKRVDHSLGAVDSNDVCGYSFRLGIQILECDSGDRIERLVGVLLILPFIEFL